LSELLFLRRPPRAEVLLHGGGAQARKCADPATCTRKGRLTRGVIDDGVGTDGDESPLLELRQQTTLANGVHTIFWIAASTDGTASGIGSRYFAVSNGTAAIQSATSDGLRSSVSAAAPIEEVDAAPVDQSAIQERRGFDVSAPTERYSAADGRITVPAQELNRIELQFESPAIGDYAGYLRTVTGLLPLPAGSHFDPTTGVFTWMPGAGFLGAYDFVFVQSSAGRVIARREVRVVLNRRDP
jgi:hypothetical protein